VESSCELGNESSGSIKCWESTEWLHDMWPLERYSAPRVIYTQNICKRLQHGKFVVPRISCLLQKKKKNKFRGPQSASERYRLSDRHLSPKFLVPTFVDRGVSRGQRGGSPTVVNLSFLNWIVSPTKQYYMQCIEVGRTSRITTPPSLSASRSLRMNLRIGDPRGRC
jgi:hypothetical protein